MLLQFEGRKPRPNVFYVPIGVSSITHTLRYFKNKHIGLENLREEAEQILRV